MTACDKVAKAIRHAREHAHPGLHYTERLADAAIAAHLQALADEGKVVVPRRIVDDLVSMFRDVENGQNQLYYAPIHRMVDLLAEVGKAEPDPADELVRVTEELGLYPKDEASDE